MASKGRECITELRLLLVAPDLAESSGEHFQMHPEPSSAPSAVEM